MARIYDFMLGGKDNFAADREAATELLRVQPQARAMAHANRRFLVRAVRFLAEAGVRQFIDLGTGIPTSPNVHEIAGATHPDVRVVYVDNDPVVAVHNRALRAVRDRVVSIQADIREPAMILDHPTTTALIDFTKPVAVLFLMVLHFVTDEQNPGGIVAAFRDRVASGSYIAISIATNEGLTHQEVADFIGPFENATSRATLRSREQIEVFFNGVKLVEPGLVGVSHWRAAGPRTPEPLAGLGLKI